jgi:hypothetical protein
MSKMFNLIEALSSNATLNNDQIKDHISKLDMFRFDSNNILNTLGQLMNGAADGGDFKPSEVSFRDLGLLLSMLTELSALCEDTEGFYRRKLEEKEVKLEAVS